MLYDEIGYIVNCFWWEVNSEKNDDSAGVNSCHFEEIFKIGNDNVHYKKVE